MGTFTRLRKTKKSVIILANKISTTVITAEGILVIVAVSGILLFLVMVVIPLFQGAKVTSFTSYKLPLKDVDPLFAEVDEYHSLGIVLSRKGILTAFHAATGEKIFEKELITSDAEVTAFSRTLRGGYTTLGLTTGEISLGNLSFKSLFLEEEKIPESLKNLNMGTPVIFEKGILQRVSESLYRKIEANIDFALRFAPQNRGR